MDFSFNEDQFNQLYPFYILINADLTIAGQGKAVDAFTTEAVGRPFAEYFSIAAPAQTELTFDSLQKLAGQPAEILINRYSTEIQYGKFISLPQSGQLMFVATDEGHHNLRGRETFLANISHEIRTPMSGILGLAKILSRTNIDGKQRSYINLITESVSNLLLIVNDMLDIEKIGAGKIELESKAFRITNKVQSTIQLFQFKSAQKNIQITFKNNLPANLVVVGDEFRFAQVLSNLLSNALKFTHKGTIMVTADLLFYSDTKLLIEFSVTDTGIGISEERLASIFNPFSQVSTSYTRKYGGTGLGLSICKSLIEMQGGHIKVSSKLNEGTQFTFSIPYQRGDTSMISEEVEQTAEYEDLAGKKVLIADDLELNQFLAKSLLESWGCYVDIVDNGQEAYERIQIEDFDLILMDVQMPEMDGLTATRRIRSLPDPVKANVPVLAFTAKALRGDSVQFTEAGMNDYILKPYAEEKLYNKVAKLLNINGFERSMPEKNADRPQADTKKLYDLTMLKAIGKDNDAFVDKMISLFLNLATADVKLMREAADTGNNEEVGRLAHKMKSSLSNLGITSLLDQVRTLELKGNEPGEPVAEETKQFENDLNQVVAQMEADFPHLARG